jgi:hypothetical protein
MYVNLSALSFKYVCVTYNLTHFADSGAVERLVETGLNGSFIAVLSDLGYAFLLKP